MWVCPWKCWHSRQSCRDCLCRENGLSLFLSEVKESLGRGIKECAYFKLHFILWPVLGGTQELHEGSATQPSIVVVTPEDADDDNLKPAVLKDQQQVQTITSLPSAVVHTPRPPIRN